MARAELPSRLFRLIRQVLTMTLSQIRSNYRILIDVLSQPFAFIPTNLTCTLAIDNIPYYFCLNRLTGLDQVCVIEHVQDHREG